MRTSEQVEMREWEPFSPLYFELIFFDVPKFVHSRYQRIEFAKIRIALSLCSIKYPA